MSGEPASVSLHLIKSPTNVEQALSSVCVASVESVKYRVVALVWQLHGP